LATKRVRQKFPPSSESEIPDTGWKKNLMSEIRDKYPESATLIIMGVIVANMTIFVRQTEEYSNCMAKSKDA
jgi:hypothetical protein